MSPHESICKNLSYLDPKEGENLFNDPKNEIVIKTNGGREHIFKPKAKISLNAVEAPSAVEAPFKENRKPDLIEAMTCAIEEARIMIGQGIIERRFRPREWSRGECSEGNSNTTRIFNPDAQLIALRLGLSPRARHVLRVLGLPEELSEEESRELDGLFLDFLEEIMTLFRQKLLEINDQQSIVKIKQNRVVEEEDVLIRRDREETAERNSVEEDESLELVEKTPEEMREERGVIKAMIENKISGESYIYAAIRTKDGPKGVALTLMGEEILAYSLDNTSREMICERLTEERLNQLIFDSVKPLSKAEIKKMNEGPSIFLLTLDNKATIEFALPLYTQIK